MAGAIKAVQGTLRDAHEYLARGGIEMARRGYFEALDLITMAGRKVDQGSAEHHTVLILDLTCRMSFASTLLDEDPALADGIYRSVDEKMRAYGTDDYGRGFHGGAPARVPGRRGARGPAGSVPCGPLSRPA